MGTIRFALLAAGLFGLAFVAVSWANKGFPVMVTGVVPVRPDARVPTFTPVSGGEGSAHWREEMRQDWENSKTSRSDGNIARDKVRRELLQASTAYELSPCNATIRNDLIKALGDYTRAWYDMAFCRPGLNGCPVQDDARIDRAAAAFKTPADARVREALELALEQGGISRDDFPAPINRHVLMWTGPLGEPKAACVVARQAMK